MPDAGYQMPVATLNLKRDIELKRFESVEIFTYRLQVNYQHLF